MQGMHALEPKTKASSDLESFVSEDHFLRRINRDLDRSLIRELTTAHYSDGQGRPSIDPEVYFRMPFSHLTVFLIEFWGKWLSNARLASSTFISGTPRDQHTGRSSRISSILLRTSLSVLRRDPS